MPHSNDVFRIPRRVRWVGIRGKEKERKISRGGRNRQTGRQTTGKQASRQAGIGKEGYDALKF